MSGRERRCGEGETWERENINRGVWELIAARFVGQLSWGTRGGLDRKDEKKGTTGVVQQRFPPSELL